jgi:ribosomal protein L17
MSNRSRTVGHPLSRRAFDRAERFSFFADIARSSEQQLRIKTALSTASKCNGKMEPQIQQNRPNQESNRREAIRAISQYLPPMR